MKEFHSHITPWILEIKHEHYQEYEKDLKSRGRMIRARTNFEFSDNRKDKWYLAREHGEWRMETVMDLLPTIDTGGDEPVIEMVINVTDIPESPPASPSSAKHSAKASIKYHRYGTGKTSVVDTEDDRQQHESTTVAVLMPYTQNVDDQTEPDPILVLQRMINNTAIGSAGDTTHPKGQVDKAPWDYITPYKELCDDKERGEKMWEVVAAKKESGEDQEAGIPKLPFVTFLPYLGKGGTDRIAKSHTSLAIRARSWLHSLGAGDLKLPLDWSEVVDSHITSQGLCDVLCDHMQDLCPLKGMKRLGELAGLKKWRMDIWVMPQGKQMEKLHFFRSNEKLVKYLDPVLVDSGERKLYVEVHLCVN